MVQRELKNKVSIILPNFNSAKYILSTVNSVIKQSYKDWNLIIIDDCSNTKTKSILEKFKDKRIKIIWLKKNKGAAYCRNLGIKKTRSKFLAFIDADDIWEKNKLKTQLKFMEKNNLSFTYTYYKTFDLKSRKIRTPIKFDFNNFTKNTSIATSSMIVERKIVEGINFTDTPICEDYFFKCKILKRIKYAYCLKNYLTKYRIRKNSMQNNMLKNFYWIWKINYKYNKFGILKNLISLFFISLNSIKKYGLK